MVYSTYGSGPWCQPLCVTEYHSDSKLTIMYLGCTFILCHSVPCGSKQCGWSEVARGWKQLLELITGSLEKGGIRCLPVESVSKSSNAQIIPKRSNQCSVDEKICSRNGNWNERSPFLFYLWMIELSNPVIACCYSKCKQISWSTKLAITLDNIINIATHKATVNNIIMNWPCI